MASATQDGYTVESNETDEQLAAEVQPMLPDSEPAAKTADGAPPSQAEPKPKPRSDPQARVQDATAKEAAAKRERDEARAENARLKAENEALKNPRQPQVADKPAEKVADWKRFRALPDAPKLADFDGPEALEDHAAAMADFVATKRYEESRRVESQTAEQTRREASEAEHYAKFERRLIDASGTDDPEGQKAWVKQFDPRLVNAPRASTLPPGETPSVASLITEEIYRSNAPVEKLLAHFSDEPEVQRLATLLRDQGYGAFLREFANIASDYRLTPAAAPLRSGTAAPVKESKAKPPIRPERGSSQVGNDEPPGDDASDAEHEAYWGPRRAKLRRA